MQFQRHGRCRKRLVEPDLETCDQPPKSDVLTDQSDAGADERHGIRAAADLVFRDDVLHDFFRHRFAHAHHLFHESAVELETGKQRDQSIPTQQIVIHPSADQSEHLREDIFGARDAFLRHRHEFAELAIDRLIDPPGEGKRQRRGHSAITLGDVAIVPDAQRVVGIGREPERGDGAALQ
jgi:hypothetical protein